MCANLHKSVPEGALAVQERPRLGVEKEKGSEMAIPGFTAEAAFYPTATRRRMVREDDVGPSCMDQCWADWWRCNAACGNMGGWQAYCDCVCANQMTLCAYDCGVGHGLIEACIPPI